MIIQIAAQPDINIAHILAHCQGWLIAHAYITICKAVVFYIRVYFGYQLIYLEVFAAGVAYRQVVGVTVIYADYYVFAVNINIAYVVYRTNSDNV